MSMRKQSGRGSIFTSRHFAGVRNSCSRRKIWTGLPSFNQHQLSVGLLQLLSYVSSKQEEKQNGKIAIIFTWCFLTEIYT